MIETLHTVTLEIPEIPELPEGYAGAPESAGSVTLSVQITPKTPGYAMENYGAEITKPHKMMGNPADEPYFKMDGAKVTWDRNGSQVEFFVRGGHRYHGQGDDCDHVSVMLEEINADA